MMSFWSNPFKAIKAAFRHPGKAICSLVGANHEKQTIIDHASEQRAQAMGVLRSNNKYVPASKESGEFGDLDRAIEYKKWLHDNGPNNINSPYYSSARVSNKQGTQVLGFTGHPNEYIHYEDRFDHNAYNRDLGQAEHAIVKCKEHINLVAQQCKSVIAHCVNNEDYDQQIVKLLQSDYQNGTAEYSDLCSKNKAINQAIGAQKAILREKQQEVAQSSKALQKIKTEIKSYAAAIGLSKNSAEQVIVAAKLGKQQVEIHKKLSALSASDRAKLLFNIFDSELQKPIFDMIVSMSFDANILAYMATHFDKLSIFDFALSKGADVDGYFVHQKTILEWVLATQKQVYIDKAMDAVISPVCTILNAAANKDFVTLATLYKNDPNIFAKHDEIIGYGIAHLLILGNHVVALEYIKQNLDQNILQEQSLSGESVVEVVLRSGSNEAINLFQEADILVEIDKLILTDKEYMVKQILSKYNNLSIAGKIQIVEFAAREHKKGLIEELFQDDLALVQTMIEQLITQLDYTLGNFLVEIFAGSLDPQYISTMQQQTSFSFDAMLDLNDNHTEEVQLGADHSDAIGDIA